MTPPTPPNRDPVRIAFWIVLAVAAGLRLWGIGHSLPYSYYPDESHFVKRALSFGSGDLNPHWFHKPAFYMYLLFAEYGIFYLAGYVGGLWDGASEFAVRYVLDPGGFYLIGRLTTAAFSLATVWLVYRIGRRAFCRQVGLAAAAVFAVIPGVVAPSQHVKEDIPSMFFAALSLYVLLRYLDSRRTSTLCLAAVAAGASAATKSYGLALLAPLAASVFLSDGRLPLRRALSLVPVIFGVFWATYFVLAPFSFLDPLGREFTLVRFIQLGTRIGEIFGIAHPTSAPDEFITRQTGFSEGFSEYFGVLVSSEGMTWSAAAAALAGLFLAPARDKRNMVWFLAGYTVLFAVVSVVLYPGYAEPRHQTPVYPTLSLFAGYTLWFASRRLPSLLAAGLVALTLAVPVVSTVTRALKVSKEDTRNAAKRWIELHIPPGTPILVDENGPPLLHSPEAIHRMRERMKGTPTGMATHYGSYLDLQARAANHGRTYDVHEIRKAWWRSSEPPGEYLTSEYDRDMANPFRPVGVRSYDEYVRRGLRYAVVHSDQYRAFLNESGASTWPSFARFYRELFRYGALVREFSPENGPWTGPTVRIYRLTPPGTR